MKIFKRVFIVELLMISEGAPVFVEDGWRDHIDVYFACVLFSFYIYSNYLFFFSPSWIKVLTFLNYPRLWVIHLVGHTGPSSP